MFANCRAITGATLHYMFVLYVQNRLLRFRLPVITDTWAVQQSLLLKRSMGLETSAGCLASGGHHPCVPCVRRFSRPGSHHSPSFSSRPSPSCGTCGSGRSPARCGMARAERQKGHSSPGNWWQHPCHPFLGWPWRNPRSRCRLCHCWACRLGPQQTSWRRAGGTPSCGCAGPRKI